MACVSGGTYFAMRSLRSAKISRNGRVSVPGRDSSRERHFISAHDDIHGRAGALASPNEPIADEWSTAVYCITFPENSIPMGHPISAMKRVQGVWAREYSGG